MNSSQHPNKTEFVCKYGWRHIKEWQTSNMYLNKKKMCQSQDRGASWWHGNVRWMQPFTVTSYECHAASNHRQLNSLFNCFWGLETKKIPRLRFTGYLKGETTDDRSIPPSKRPVLWKGFPYHGIFNIVIKWLVLAWFMVKAKLYNNGVAYIQCIILWYSTFISLSLLYLIIFPVYRQATRHQNDGVKWEANHHQPLINIYNDSQYHCAGHGADYNAWWWFSVFVWKQ